MSRQNFTIERLLVVIDEISGTTAMVVDEFGRNLRIRTNLRRGKGPLPRAGEKWIIDQRMGQWSFAACVRPDLPTITGSTDNNPALKSLLAALDEAGLIIDGTVDTQLRAAHPHTHPHTHGIPVHVTEESLDHTHSIDALDTLETESDSSEDVPVDPPPP